MTQKKAIILLLVPYALLAMVYFGMGFLRPNYMVSPVHIMEPYGLEKMLFGIPMAAGIVTPNEWFAQHHCATLDLLSGLSYLLWIPLPAFFSLWLLFTGRQSLAIKLTIALFLTKLVGYVGYYCYPAAPPWYVMEHGFVFLSDTHGSAAGLLRVDQLLGIDIFRTMYTANANVFAAIPSLHSSYYPVAFWYAYRMSSGRQRTFWMCFFAVFSVVVWFAAVYTCHHYIIDVVLGVLCGAIGTLLCEKVIGSLVDRKLTEN